MPDTVIVAIIAGLSSIVGTYIIAKKDNHKREVQDAKIAQSYEDRLSSIEHKLDVHNGYAEKLGDISKAMVSMQKDIEYLKENKK